MTETERNTRHRVRTLAEKLLLAEVRSKGLPLLDEQARMVNRAVKIAIIFDDTVFPEKP